MECTDAYIALKDAFYCLFYEELGPGNHLSRIYHFSGRTNPQVRLVAEIREWIVSIWANRAGRLFGAVWDGQILSIGERVEPIASVDLLGTIKLAGFADEPQFIMGEDGLIFENRRGAWQRIPFRGKQDVYSVARRKADEYVFAASTGRIITYASGTASVDHLPTNVDLHGIAFTSHDKGVVVGDEGVAFLYRTGTWTDISEDRPSLQDAHAFKGRILTTLEAETIDEIAGDGSFTTAYDRPGYFFSSNDDFCVTFDDEAAHIFDGRAWVSVPFAGLIPS
ncbi:hypothetical protein GCM10007881_10700 [Mesorhizobium huakuii]|uniref:hypothetical protein n=1 Tax=Mesorhizobium huakuii TaxID=28104 RepID=UPI00235DBE9F|nr:hypothetical protein [Mesorhizobium huakuii]GLQ77554.1 hypothetical protein GCM10007881_10700 [Mesorhizobium huakuii]